jgi:hypothetical protein
MILLFTHEDNEIITSSWTVSVVRGRLAICYLCGDDEVSVFSGATSVRRKVFETYSLAEFWRDLSAADKILDLR